MLVLLLAFPPGIAAQTPAPPAQAPPILQGATIRSLRVIALGSLGMNDLQARVMAPLVVQVLDRNDLPVEGAEVVFRFPLDGPSATFADRKSSQTFRTNADGQAAAMGWTANGTVGAFQVQVTATRGNELGTGVVTLTNVTRITDEGRKPPHKNWWASHWKQLAIAGAAAGLTVGIVLATRGGSSSSSGTVITATPGSPTIGGPQ